jgi:hypothetical protein
MNKPKTRQKSAAAVLAQTWGWDISDAREYEYQPGHTGKERIFSIGMDYFCVQNAKPQWCPEELAWVPYSDQEIAKAHSTTIWVTIKKG